MHFRNDTQISIIISSEIYFVQCRGGMIRELYLSYFCMHNFEMHILKDFQLPPPLETA